MVSFVGQWLRFLRELGCYSAPERQGGGVPRIKLEGPVNALGGCVSFIVSQIEAGEYEKRVDEDSNAESSLGFGARSGEVIVGFKRMCQAGVSLSIQGNQCEGLPERRSEERRVGKECRSRWSPY